MTCNGCSSDHTARAWHLDKGKTYCDKCWSTENPNPVNTGETWENRLKRKLPRGSVLGPKVKGSDMRGVFKRNR